MVKLSEDYNENTINHEIKLKASFMCFMIKKHWRRKLKRKGKDPNKRIIASIKMCLTVIGAAKANNYLEAKVLFTKFSIHVMSHLKLLSRFDELAS